MIQMNPWLVCPVPRQSARRRFFCLPYAGAGAAAFRGWAEKLPDDVEILSVQLPGREGRIHERPFTSMEQLVPPLAAALKGLLDRPYFLYGQSLGAMVAFEVARELRRRGAPLPDHLFLAASPAPRLPRPYPKMHSLPDDDFLREIDRRYGGVPRQVMDDAELRALLLPVLRADVTVLETYRYTPEIPLACGITAFGGRDDRMVCEASLDAWRDETCSVFRIQMFPGDHFFPQSSSGPLLRTISTQQIWVHENSLPLSGAGGLESNAV